MTGAPAPGGLGRGRAGGVIATDVLKEITAADVRAGRVFKISAGAVASRASLAVQDGDL
jgi:hypothetical protein